MVTGLPDFTHLVDQVGPAVVNVEANVGGGPSDQPAMDDDEEMPEFFKRFFGPGGMPMPQMPPGGGGRDRGVSMGTGFIISADGYVLTNHHVVDGADEVTVRLIGPPRVQGQGRRQRRAVRRRAAQDRRHQPADAARRRFAQRSSPGSGCVAIGSPFGFDHSVTAGIVSARRPPNPYSRPALRALHPDRRRDQPRQFRRPAAQHARRGGRHQLADLQQLRRLHGRELRDPDRGRDERGATSSSDSGNVSRGQLGVQVCDGIDSDQAARARPARHARRARRATCRPGSARGEGRHPAPAT